MQECCCMTGCVLHALLASYLNMLAGYCGPECGEAPPGTYRYALHGGFGQVRVWDCFPGCEERQQRQSASRTVRSAMSLAHFGAELVKLGQVTAHAQTAGHVLLPCAFDRRAVREGLQKNHTRRAGSAQTHERAHRSREQAAFLSVGLASLVLEALHVKSALQTPTARVSTDGCHAWNTLTAVLATQTVQCVQTLMR